MGVETGAPSPLGRPLQRVLVKVKGAVRGSRVSTARACCARWPRSCSRLGGEDDSLTPDGADPGGRLQAADENRDVLCTGWGGGWEGWARGGAEEQRGASTHRRPLRPSSPTRPRPASQLDLEPSPPSPRQRAPPLKAQSGCEWLRGRPCPRLQSQRCAVPSLGGQTRGRHSCRPPGLADRSRVRAPVPRVVHLEAGRRRAASCPLPARLSASDLASRVRQSRHPQRRRRGQSWRAAPPLRSRGGARRRPPPGSGLEGAAPLLLQPVPHPARAARG